MVESPRGGLGRGAVETLLNGRGRGRSDAREWLSQQALRPVAEQWKVNHWDPGHSSCWRKAGLLGKMHVTWNG